MKNKSWLLIALSVLLLPLNGNAQQPTLDAMIDSDLASLVATYKTLHASPELSHYEEKTSSFFAGQLRALGYTVTERVGKYENPAWTNYGVVAVMKNGGGPACLGLRVVAHPATINPKFSSTIHTWTWLRRF